jgi:hypothetical protein
MTSTPNPDPAGAKAHQDELLDEALDESFPASDPPAMTEPKPNPSLKPRPGSPGTAAAGPRRGKRPRRRA